jgi:hypothetical protein
MVAGQWSQEQLQGHVITLEFKTVTLAIQHWLPKRRGQSVLVMSDNTTVCACIRLQGSCQLSQQAEHLHQLTHAAGIHLTVRHIPGRLNVITDSLSR